MLKYSEGEYIYITKKFRGMTSLPPYSYDPEQDIISLNKDGLIVISTYEASVKLFFKLFRLGHDKLMLCVRARAS